VWLEATFFLVICYTQAPFLAIKFADIQPISRQILLCSCRFAHIMPTNGAMHIPLEPGVNAPNMKPMVACIQVSRFRANCHSILANGANILFSIHNLNSGICIDLSKGGADNHWL
jgi:hypothetical protein